MIRSIADFEYQWSHEIEATQKIFKHLTDKSMVHEFSPDVRTLGRLAWHITTTIPEMMGKTGLKLTGPGVDDPIPSSAKSIFNAYNGVAISLLDEMKAQWTDASLDIVDEMYGQRWKRGQTLTALINHQIHHRGGMVVLMRLAGLGVPGIYGPTRDEWSQWGMQPPKV